MCQHRFQFVQAKQSACFIGDQNGSTKGKRECVSTPQGIEPGTGCWTLPIVRQFAHRLGQLRVSGSKETQPMSDPEETIKLDPEVNDETGDQNDSSVRTPDGWELVSKEEALFTVRLNIRLSAHRRNLHLGPTCSS